MHALGYKSPNSAAILIDRLVRTGILRRRSDGSLQSLRDPEQATGEMTTVNVPLVGTIAAGTPILAEENVEAMIPVSSAIARTPHRYFLLRVHGDSMDKAGIKDGDFVLVRQQQTAENGDRVVALIDNEAMVKEFYRQGDVVLLRPKSSNKEHQPIIAPLDLIIQGKVVATIPQAAMDIGEAL